MQCLTTTIEVAAKSVQVDRLKHQKLKWAETKVPRIYDPLRF
jgi:hypothetical protein